MTAATIVAVVAAAVALLALAAAILVLRKVRAHEHMLEREIDRGKDAFDEVVAAEIAQRSEELGHTMARLRADALSALTEEERRIAEDRRRDVAERERDATVRLMEQIVAAQANAEQRLTDWASDVEKLQEGLAGDLKRIEARQQQALAEIESKIGTDADRLQASVEDQRQLVARLRADLERQAQEIMDQATADLEQHASERRHALHEVADRLRKRERDLQEVVGTRGERRRRAHPGRPRRCRAPAGRAAAAHRAHARRRATRKRRRSSSTRRFAARARKPRAGLSRELDLAVERFAREAEGVLTERLNHVSDAAAQRVEERLARLRAGLERQRDDALNSLEERAHQVESGLRERLHEIAADAEAERAVLEARLHELARKVDELTANA